MLSPRWGNPSLVIRGVDKNGATVCVQCVGLTDDGNKRAFWGKVSKQTLGRATGVGALLSGVGPEYENVVLFAEGPETGLTAWAATGIATKIAFGSLAKLEPDAGLLTCILRDDDPARVERSNGNEKKTVRNPSHRGIRKAVENWRNRGLRVIDCDPWPIRRSDKSDFNDMAKAHGIGAVRERILLSVRYAQTCIKLPTAPLEEARIQTDHIAADFLRRALSERSEAFTLGAKIDLGVGKTHSALANCRLALKEMRAAGDERVVVFAVPDHKLGGEVADRFNQEEDGLRAAVFRGRQAIDPFSEDGAGMCRNIDAVQLAQARALDPREAVCDAGCPMRSSCAYLAQDTLRADLFVVAHQRLLSAPPKPIKRCGVAALVVDETLFRAGLFGVDDDMSLPIDALEHDGMPVPQGLSPATVRALQEELRGLCEDRDLERRAAIHNELHKSERDKSDGAWLKRMRRTLGRACRANGVGPLRRASLMEALEARFWEEIDVGPALKGVEWRRRFDSGTAEQLDLNRTIPIMGPIWMAVGRLLEGSDNGVSGELDVYKDREGAIRLRVRGRSDVNTIYADAPKMLIDADLRQDLAGCYFPDFKKVEEIIAETPHMRVRQHILSYPMRMLVPRADNNDKKDAEYRRRKIRGLLGIVRREAREAGQGGVLLVTYKATVDALLELGLPENVEFAHFGAVRGRDKWKAVTRILIVGRPMPASDKVENMAMALTRRTVMRVPDSAWYPQGDRLHLIAGRDAQGRPTATFHITEGPVHPDPTVEEVRQSICDDEIRQAIGRGRGVTRTADNPLVVTVLSDACLMMPVELLRDEDLKLDALDLMLNEDEGLVYRSPRLAAAAYPHLWANEQAARRAFQGDEGLEGSFEF